MAAFAHAKLGRLLLVELVVAGLVASTVVWFLACLWFPTIRKAIQQLPTQGAIRNQRLDLPSSVAQTLAETRPFLIVVLDLEKQRNASQTSDVLVEFHRKNYAICSLLGCVRLDYPKWWTIDFNRPKLEPWWEAWQPIFLGLSALVVIVLLLLSWAFLALIWCGLVRLLGFFKDRDLNWRSSWRVASASLLPGALLLTAGIWGYGLGVVDLIRLLLLFVIHFFVGGAYAVISSFFVPRLSSVPTPGLNPFVVSESEPTQDA